jgi:hypothetical protein
LSDSGAVRVQKIESLIRESRYAIHDISRAGIDRTTRLARFNMPLELGMFLGAMRFGAGRQATKECLILDVDAYRYRTFCSDISGQDIAAHQDTTDGVIGAARDWLSARRKGVIVPGAAAMRARYARFRKDLPSQARASQLSHASLTFADFTTLLAGWLTENPW